MYNTSLRLYGEDTTEYASDPSPMVLQLILACYQAGSKTQAVAIGSSLYEHELHLKDMTVETQDTLKILAVILDNKLNFN